MYTGVFWYKYSTLYDKCVQENMIYWIYTMFGTFQEENNMEQNYSLIAIKIYTEYIPQEMYFSKIDQLKSP